MNYASDLADYLVSKTKVPEYAIYKEVYAYAKIYKNTTKLFVFNHPS